MKGEFRCCFKKCKYKAESIIFVLEHMQDKHKLRIGKDLIKPTEKEGKSVEEKE